MKPPAVPTGRMKDSSSSSEESDSEDEQPAKVPAPSESIAIQSFIVFISTVNQILVDDEDI